MADLSYGYVEGQRIVRKLPVDASSSDISAGDMLTMGTAGYVQQAAAGDEPYAVAMQDLTITAGGSDGDQSILADVSTMSVYSFPPDTGTVAAAKMGQTMDVGGPRSVNIDASTDDSLVCVWVDVDANLLHVTLNPTRTGAS